TIDVSECFVMASSRRKKGGVRVGKTKRGKGTKILATADGHSLPIAVGTASASPQEVIFVEVLLKDSFTGRRPKRFIGDKAYDSDGIDKRRARDGTLGRILCALAKDLESRGHIDDLAVLNERFCLLFLNKRHMELTIISRRKLRAPAMRILRND